MVEDDPVIADMLKELLAGAGYRVAWAPDVISALFVLERNPVDLITLDIELGTYSGGSLLALLKTDTRTHDIPVIVISSSPVDPDVRRLANHVLSKPFNIGPLLQAIGASLERKVAHRRAWQETPSGDNPELEVAHELLD